MGRNLELVPDRRIVQSWRTSEFAADDPDSTITIELTPLGAGTRLSLRHVGVPDGQTAYEKGGWRDNYFEPMKAYFARRGASPRPRKEGEPNAKPDRLARRCGRGADARLRRRRGGLLRRVRLHRSQPLSFLQDLTSGPNCEFLYVMRNGIYAQHGYCFHTPRAIATFGNRGCLSGDANALGLNAIELANATTILSAERALGCPE